MKYNFKKLIFAQLVSLAFVFMQSGLIYAGDADVPVRNSKKKADEAKQKEIFIMAGVALAIVGTGGAMALTIVKNKIHEANIKKLQDQNTAFVNTTKGVVTSHKQLADSMAASDVAVQKRKEAIDGKLADTQRSVNALKKKVKDVNDLVCAAQTVADTTSEQLEAMRQSFTLPEPLPLLNLESAHRRQLAMGHEARRMIDNGHQYPPVGNIYATEGPHRTVFEVSNDLVTVLRNQARAHAEGYHLGFAPVAADNPLVLPAPPAHP